MKDFLDYIDSKNAGDLKVELKELYSSYEVVRNYFHIKMQGNKRVDKALLKKYQDEIIKALYPNDRMEGGLDLEKVDSILTQLNSETTIQYYIQCCLFSIEECTEVAHTFGGDFGDDFFIYFEELFEHITQLIIHRGLESKYRERLGKIVNSAFDGYGHNDQLQDILSQYIQI